MNPQTTYIQTPHPKFKTVGIHNLFTVWLNDHNTEKYGKKRAETDAESLNDYLQSRQNAELWCNQCGTTYSLDCFGKDLKLEWVLNEDKGPSPLHITKPGLKPYKNPKDLSAKCKNKECSGGTLNYLLNGNLKTMASVELEMIILNILPEREFEFEESIWKTTTYSKAIGCRNDANPLEYLVKQGLVRKREFDLDRATVDAYKLTESGCKKVKEIEKELFDDYSILTQFYEFLVQRFKKLDKSIEIHEKKDLTIKHIAGKAPKPGQNKIENFPEDYSKPKAIVHIPEKWLNRIWAIDRKIYWNRI